MTSNTHTEEDSARVEALTLVSGRVPGQSAVVAAVIRRRVGEREQRRTVRASGRAGCALEARKAGASPVVAPRKPVQATLFAACATGCETSGACRHRPVAEVGHVRSAVRPSPAGSSRRPQPAAADDDAAADHHAAPSRRCAAPPCAAPYCVQMATSRPVGPPCARATLSYPIVAHINRCLYTNIRRLSHANRA